jgi:triphosphatase
MLIALQRVKTTLEVSMVNRSREQTAAGSSRSSRRPVGTDQQEIEWQYDAEELGPVEEWIGERGGDPGGSGLTVAKGPTKELADTYYDTEDWGLYRAGYALRVRQGTSGKRLEATMKALTSAGADSNLRRRREISEPLKGGGTEAFFETSGPVGERLRALVGAREMRPIFEVRTRRRTFDLLRLDERTGDGPPGIVEDASGDIRPDKSAVRVGEVALDASEIPLDDGGEPARLARVEIEVDASVADDATGLLEGFVEAMGEALDLRPATISKYEAGLFATGQSPRGDLEDLGSDSVDDSLSVEEVAFAVLRRQFAAMKAHEAGTRLGEDPEELHDMRVATRRMRAAIKLFEDALPERTRWLRGELKFFASVLGDVRDLDVQIEQFEDRTATTDQEGFEALSKAMTALEERRAEARERLLDALNSDRYERFESSFADMLRRGPVGETLQESEDRPAADEPILDAAPSLLSRPYHKWRKAAKRIKDGSSDPEEYHDLRKKGKRLRYALEFLSDVYGEEATDELVKPLKKLQDDLGRHQDLIVSGDLLEEIATSRWRLARRTVFAMGALAGRYRQEAADLRASVPRSKTYGALKKGKTWKGFEKAMEKRRRSFEKDEPDGGSRSKKKK